MSEISILKAETSDDCFKCNQKNADSNSCDDDYDFLPGDDSHFMADLDTDSFRREGVSDDYINSGKLFNSSSGNNFSDESGEGLNSENPAKSGRRFSLKMSAKAGKNSKPGTLKKMLQPNLKDFLGRTADSISKSVGIVTNKKNPVDSRDSPEKILIRFRENLNDLNKELKNYKTEEEWSESLLKSKNLSDMPVGGNKILLPPGYEELERYWLRAPHSYAVIARNREKNKSYLVYEPGLSEKEHLILEETDAQLRAVLIYDSAAKKDEMEIEYETVIRIIKKLDPHIEKERTDIICYYLVRNFQGYGKLDPLMHDENIEDITCNGFDNPLFIYHRKHSNLPVNIIFDKEELNRFVLKIAQKADKQLSLTTPLVDASLPGGARAQITYTDVISSKGSSFTIRKFKSDPMTPVDLIDYGTYDAEILAFIWLCVENRKSAIVVGGTASGKTSMMNAFSLFIPQFAKIVSIEDTREIQMPHKNWLPMKTRESASESGKGNVDMFSLLKTALRQRPEYIIVGEVRGSEAQTLFQAMNTGHTTYSTLHAGGVEQAINRLTTNPINVPVAMFGALDLIIIQQLQHIGGRMVRRCITIDEVITEKGDIRYNVLYSWNPAGDIFQKVYTESKILKDIAYGHGWTPEETERQIRVRKEILEGLLKKGIRKSDEITAVFDEFSKSGRYEFEE